MTTTLHPPGSLTMPPPSRVKASTDWSSSSSSSSPHLHLSKKRSLPKTLSVPEMSNKNSDSRGMLKRWKSDSHDLLNSLSAISLEAHGDILPVLKKPVWSNGAERITASRHALKRPLRTVPAPAPANLPPTNQSSPSLQIRRSSSILKCKSQCESVRSSYRSTESLNHLRSSTHSITSISSNTSNVSFDRVSIREYPRCVGDNPSVRAGPPMRCVHATYSAMTTYFYDYINLYLTLIIFITINTFNL